MPGAAVVVVVVVVVPGAAVDGGFTKTSLDEAGLLLPTELIAVTLHLNPCP